MVRGDVIRQKRQEMGLSLRAFAKMVNLSPSYMSDIELGKKEPTVSNIVAIANALGCPLSLLLEEEGGCEEWKKNS